MPASEPIVLEDKFVGAKDPMWELTSEQPWHRFAAYAFAMGANMKDVARRLGKSEPAVQNLVRQPWFQKEINTLMSELGRNIYQMFEAESINCLTTLVEMRDNPRVPAHARILCAKDILDRGLGKPVQRIETANVASSDDPVAEVERLEEEVNRLRAGASSEPTRYSGASYRHEWSEPA